MVLPQRSICLSIRDSKMESVATKVSSHLKSLLMLQRSLQKQSVFFHSNLFILKVTKQCRRSPGGYLGEFLLGMCRWPLRVPTPLQSILWPIIDPISVTFGQICIFCDPNLVTFYLCIYLILNEKHSSFHQQYKHSGTFGDC